MTNLLLRDPFLAAPLRLMGELWAGTGDAGRPTGFVPSLDVRETGDEYVVMVDLPGVKSEDVSIELSDQVLTISGSRAPVEIGEAQRVERPYGSFVRTLTLPNGIEDESVVADCVDGVLELRIPKPARVKPKRIAIGAGSPEAVET
jgi:HSP20 family protein